MLTALAAASIFEFILDDITDKLLPKALSPETALGAHWEGQKGSEAQSGSQGMQGQRAYVQCLYVMSLPGQDELSRGVIMRS